MSLSTQIERIDLIPNHFFSRMDRNISIFQAASSYRKRIYESTKLCHVY
jgi:hypothetical protein